jgi:hypothetical protein
MARIPVTIATHLGRSTLNLPNKVLDLDASMMPEVVAQFLTRRDQDCIDDVDDAVGSLNIRGDHVGVVDANPSALKKRDGDGGSL